MCAPFFYHLLWFFSQHLKLGGYKVNLVQSCNITAPSRTDTEYRFLSHWGPSLLSTFFINRDYPFEHQTPRHGAESSGR
jgi:hypothetical protein